MNNLRIYVYLCNFLLIVCHINILRVLQALVQTVLTSILTKHTFQTWEMLNNKSIGKGQIPIVTKVVLSGISGDLVAGTCQSNKYLDQYLERDKGFEKQNKSLIKVLKHSQYFLLLLIWHELTCIAFSPVGMAVWMDAQVPVNSSWEVEIINYLKKLLNQTLMK